MEQRAGMDDRITRIERLAALHRDGALTDDEFRDEKLRVLGGRAEIGADPIPPADPVDPPEPIAPPPRPVPAEAVVADEPVAIELEPVFEPELAPEGRSGPSWWIIGTAVVIAALLGAIWYASTITVADAPRSSVGTATTRRLATPAEPVLPEPEPVATDVSDALAFSDPGQCQFGPSGDRAFRALLSERDGEWGSDGPVRLGPLTLTPKLDVSRTGSEEGLETVRYTASARAPEGVEWNGLTLSRLIHSLNLPDGTDPLEERSLTFLEDPKRVGRVLRTLGVSVPVGDGSRELEDGACGGTMRIKAIPGGSALVCQWGC